MRDKRADLPRAGRPHEGARPGLDLARPGVPTSVGNIRLNHLECIDVGLMCFDALPYWEPWDKFTILLVCHLRKSSKILGPTSEDWRSWLEPKGGASPSRLWSLAVGLCLELWISLTCLCG